MKRALIMAVLVTVMVGGGAWPVFAETVQVQDKHYNHSHVRDVTVHDKTAAAVMPHNTMGFKTDAPNLVRFTDNLTFGVEGGKDMWENVFYPDYDNSIEADRGYFAYAKVTYTGTLFDFSKK